MNSIEGWIQKLSENNFAALRGLSVAGVVPVREDLINEWLAGLLQTAPAEPAAPALPLNWNALKPFLKQLEVRAADGRVAVSFRIEV